ncbi:hypothetical protein [Chromobacterium violaceum]|uniref:hypothetical protein n=1 Tax=Chromobacterium violaceum TaxID=536 RepID=UPI0011D0B3A9|nr:hypothetical protein [Chromobacterium violaceum]
MQHRVAGRMQHHAEEIQRTQRMLQPVVHHLAHQEGDVAVLAAEFLVQPGLDAQHAAGAPAYLAAEAVHRAIADQAAVLVPVQQQAAVLGRRGHHQVDEGGKVGAGEDGVVDLEQLPRQLFPFMIGQTGGLHADGLGDAGHFIPLCALQQRNGGMVGIGGSDRYCPLSLCI